MKICNLNGKWTLAKKSGDLSLAANVPGDVMNDLLHAKRIPDPFYRENEREVQWVGESDWVYERTFKVSAALFKEECMLLQCDGLDTFATVEVNGKKVASTDNMFRSYEWDVKALLTQGNNTIRITLCSVNDYTRKRFHERPIRSRLSGTHDSAYPAWVRKEQSNFGWDWGPILVTAGIWRGIRLLGYSVGRIEDVKIEQTHGLAVEATGGATGKRGLAHQSADSVFLGVEVDLGKTTRNAVSLRATLCHKGKVVAEECVTLRGRSGRLDLRVSDPQLWWPNGMGKQALYDLQVELSDGDGGGA